jgi:hypothetical protein
LGWLPNAMPRPSKSMFVFLLSTACPSLYPSACLLHDIACLLKLVAIADGETLYCRRCHFHCPLQNHHPHDCLVVVRLLLLPLVLLVLRVLVVVVVVVLALLLRYCRCRGRCHYETMTQTSWHHHHHHRRRRRHYWHSVQDDSPESCLDSVVVARPYNYH